MRCLDGLLDSMDMFEQAPGDGEGQESLVCLLSSFSRVQLCVTLQAVA